MPLALNTKRGSVYSGLMKRFQRGSVLLLKISQDRVSRQVRMLGTAFYDYFANRSVVVGLIPLRQACAVRNEDSRYEFTGKNFAVQPLCRACAFLMKQRIDVVCSLCHQ